MPSITKTVSTEVAAKIQTALSGEATPKEAIISYLRNLIKEDERRRAYDAIAATQAPEEDIS